MISKKEIAKKYPLSYAEFIIKAIGITISVISLFSLGTYLLTPNFHEDAAESRYEHIDKVLVGQESANMIENKFVKEAVESCQEGIKVKNLNSIDSAIATLGSHCEEVCGESYKPDYWSPYGQLPGGQKLVKVCNENPQCTDDVQGGLDHLQNLQSGNWLTAKRMQAYMGYYETTLFSFWEKIGIVGLLTFLFCFLYFFLTSKWRQRKKINIAFFAIKTQRKINKKLENSESYKSPGVRVDDSPQSLRVVLDQGLLDDQKLEHEAEKLLAIQTQNNSLS